MAGDSYRRIDAVKKAADIIKFLARAKAAATGQEVADGVGLPVGTTMCHLVTLADAGFVKPVGDAWLLGLGLALIHARVRANLETERARIDRDLERIAIEGEE